MNSRSDWREWMSQEEARAERRQLSPYQDIWEACYACERTTVTRCERCEAHVCSRHMSWVEDAVYCLQCEHRALTALAKDVAAQEALRCAFCNKPGPDWILGKRRACTDCLEEIYTCGWEGHGWERMPF